MWDLIVSVPDHCLSFFYECCFSLDVITTVHTTMTITNRLKITLTPLRLHSASSV